MHVIHQKGSRGDRIGRGWSCVSDRKNVWHVDKNAQMEMGFIRKNRQ